MKRFKNKDGERIFLGQRVRHIPPDIRRRARMRVQHVIAAGALSDLRRLPSHHLEALREDRKGQHGIRIDDQ